jgi:hypothetical protein
LIYSADSSQIKHTNHFDAGDCDKQRPAAIDWCDVFVWLMNMLPARVAGLFIDMKEQPLLSLRSKG